MIKLKDIGLDKVRKKLGKTIVPRVRICVECGSDKIIIVGLKEIRCQSCGSSKKIYSSNFGSKFKVGDKVKIIDSENSDIIYIIEKITKSYEGKLQYLLESKATRIKLLYHESDESQMKKV